MIDLAQNNLVIIVIAVLIGLIVAFWAFSRRGKGNEEAAAPPASAPAPAPAPPKPRASADGPEGNTLPDEFAAATKDVAGEIFGVDAHPAPVAGADGPPDNLQQLKGVGPKLAAQLNANGITRFAQLAHLGENEVALLDERMGAFRGRIARDRLVEQACYLAENDIDGFEAKFGKLGG